jgi:hypothetical protein
MEGFLTTQSGAAERLAKAYKIVSAKKLRESVKLRSAFWYIGATSYTGKNEFDYSGLLRFTSTKVTPVPAYTAYQKAAATAEGCAKAVNGDCR